MSIWEQSNYNHAQQLLTQLVSQFGPISTEELSRLDNAIQEGKEEHEMIEIKEIRDLTPKEKLVMGARGMAEQVKDPAYGKAYDKDSQYHGIIRHKSTKDKILEWIAEHPMLIWILDIMVISSVSYMVGKIWLQAADE